MRNIIRIGDSAIGHTDVVGNFITGTVTTGSDKTFSNGVGVARNGDNVYFPSHPHTMTLGVPTDYRTHNIAISGSSNTYSSIQRIALEGDIVPVQDEAGGNATLVASQSKTQAI